MRRLVAVPVTALLFFAGCATVAVPQDELTASRSSIRAAEEVGAERVPSASLHLQLARDQTTRATKLLDEGENQRAALMLERAKADAELAISLAREEPLRRDAQQALEQVEALQQRQ